MSYRHEGHDGKSLVVYPALNETASLVIEAYRHGTVIANEDAPRVALEILLAAGYEPAKHQVAIDQQDPSFAALVLSNAVLKAEEVAKSAALNKRRDELAKELSLCGYDYLGAAPILRTAIDRIIELEARS